MNSFHATFNRRADNRGSAPNLFGPQALGIKNLGRTIADNMPDNYIQVTVGNYFNVACGTCAPGYFNVNNYQVSDDFSMIKGKHQIAFGFDGRKEQFNSTEQPAVQRPVDVQRRQHHGYSGDNLADLLLGHMSAWNQGNALSDYMRQTVFAAYVQDTWRATEHLTINLGVRWEPDSRPSTSSAAATSSTWPLSSPATQHAVSERAGRIAVRPRSRNTNGCAVHAVTTGWPPRRASAWCGIRPATESKPSAPRSA